MKALGIALLLLGGALLFFGLVVGTEVSGPFGKTFHLMNLPAGMLGGLLALIGVIVLVAAEFAPQISERPPAEHADSPMQKWRALVEFDEEIAIAAGAARTLGLPYERELASAYLALSDKSYLPAILKKLGEKCEAERKAQEEQAMREPSEIERRIDHIFEVGGQMKVASLLDGRAAGWNGHEYRLYRGIATYRRIAGDSGAIYKELKSPESKRLFASKIAHLEAEILEMA